MPTPTEAMEPVLAAVESYRACERLNTTGIPREYRDQARAAIRDLVIAELEAIPCPGGLYPCERLREINPTFELCPICQRLAEWRAM